MDPISDLLDKFVSLERQVQIVRSHVDSFVFEITSSAVRNEHQPVDSATKQFKQLMNSKLSKFSEDISSSEQQFRDCKFVRRAQRDESTIAMLKSALGSSAEKIEAANAELDQLGSVNRQLEERNATMKAELTSRSQELLLQKAKIRGFKDDICREKRNIETLVQQVQDEKETEKMLADEENREVLWSEIESLRKMVAHKSVEVHGHDIELDKLRGELRRRENLEKIDKGNLIETKVQLGEEKRKVKQHEEQLKGDYELIMRLKNEMVNMREGLGRVEDERDVARKDLEEERERVKELEKLQETARELDEVLMGMTETTLKQSEKLRRKRKEDEELRKRLAEAERGKDKAVKSRDDVRKEIAELRGVEEKLARVEGELECARKRLDETGREKDEARAEVQTLRGFREKAEALAALRAVDGERVRVLQQFVDECKRRERDREQRLMAENERVKFKIESMRTAYDRLF